MGQNVFFFFFPPFFFSFFLRVFWHVFSSFGVFSFACLFLVSFCKSRVLVVNYLKGICFGKLNILLDPEAHVCYWFTYQCNVTEQVL